MDANYLTKRKGFWHYLRRVPLNLASLDERAFARQSTRIRVVDDPRGLRARRIAEKINEDTEAFWRSLLDGRADEAHKRYDAARARGFGFDYLPTDEVTRLPREALIDRVLTAKRQPSAQEESAASALLGTVPAPRLMLSALFSEFEKLSKASNKDLSLDQIRKWRNPKVRALANLLEVIGDRPVAEVSRNQALDFRAWWEERVTSLRPRPIERNGTRG